MVMTCWLHDDSAPLAARVADRPALGVQQARTGPSRRNRQGAQDSAQGHKEAARSCRCRSAIAGLQSGELASGRQRCLAAFADSTTGLPVRRNARCRGSVARASPGGRNGGPHCNANALCFVTFCAAAVGAFCVTEVIFLLGVPELICSSCSWKRGHSPPLFSCARLSRLIASVTAPFAVGRA